jgi:hypothetical protein
MAEGSIRELKCHTRRKMASSKVPIRLWDFCAKWSSDVQNKTTNKRFSLEVKTPYKAVHEHTPDISLLATFNFYELVWYCDQIAEYPKPKHRLARWLGEAHNIGQAMCYWVLPKSGVPIARSTAQEISKAFYSTEDFQQKLNILDTAIIAKFGEPVSSKEENDDNNQGYDINAPILETPQYDPWEPESQMPVADEWEPEAYDQYITAQVILPSQDAQLLGTVTARKRDLHGNPIGISNKNPIFDTRIYEITFPDGHTAEYSANTFAECLYSQIDPEGSSYAIFDEILD